MRPAFPPNSCSAPVPAPPPTQVKIPSSHLELYATATGNNYHDFSSVFTKDGIKVVGCVCENPSDSTPSICLRVMLQSHASYLVAPTLPLHCTKHSLTSSLIPVPDPVVSKGWNSLIKKISEKEEQCVGDARSLPCLQWRKRKRKLAQSTFESYSAHDGNPSTFYRRSRTQDPGPSFYFPLTP